MLDVLVAEVSLQRPRIFSGIGQGKSTGVPQHVRMGFDLDPGGAPWPPPICRQSGWRGRASTPRARRLGSVMPRHAQIVRRGQTFGQQGTRSIAERRPARLDDQPLVEPGVELAGDRPALAALARCLVRRSAHAFRMGRSFFGSAQHDFPFYDAWGYHFDDQIRQPTNLRKVYKPAGSIAPGARRAYGPASTLGILLTSSNR
jgi:hypothetical protein